MHRTKLRIRTSVALAMLAAILVLLIVSPSAALAQVPATSTASQADSTRPPATEPASPAPSAGAQSGPSSGSPASAGAPAGPTSQAGTAAAGSSTAATAGAEPAKRQSVCFKLTLRCVDTKAPAAGSGAAAGSSTQPPLNLSAPDIRSVVPADDLKEPLPTNDQITESIEDQTVQVKAEPNAPDVPGGFGALWWAVNHPSQAWRILAPAE